MLTLPSTLLAETILNPPKVNLKRWPEVRWGSRLSPSSIPMITIPFRGILFDLDGTLVNSLPAVERAWAQWSIEHGLSPEDILPKIHGRRAVDSIAALAPHLDQETAFIRLEHLEASDTTGVVPLLGAIDFVSSLVDVPWGIVTSGTSAIAEPRLQAAGIPKPPIFVPGEEVPVGKPDPAPFLEGVKRMGLPASTIVAFEDTLAGVLSAKRAQLTVICLTEEGAAEADYIISDYSQVKVSLGEDGQHALHIQ